MIDTPPPDPGDPSDAVDSAGTRADALHSRPCRPPDLEGRSRWLAELARHLGAPPDEQLQRVAQATTELCGADSVGFSSAAEAADGLEAFCWHEHPGSHHPPDAAALAVNVPATAHPEVTLLDQPVRHCADLAGADPTIVEALRAPLYVDRVPVGTLWAINHTANYRFDQEDARTLETLAHFASAAWQARERERALGALQEAQDEQKQMLETASVAARWVDADGRILWANEAELDMLGFEREEYIGRSVWEFHADEAALRDITARLTRHEAVYDHPARLICKDGSVREVEVTSYVLWRHGEFVHTRCFTRDVTERRRGEEARARLAAIVESSDDAIVSKDLNGIITSWNRGAERLFGYTADEVVGRSITLLMPPDRVDEEPGILRRIRNGDRVEHHETVRQRCDGTRLDISLTVSPLFGRNGEIIGASKIARDITARKGTERLLIETKAESERQRRLYQAVMASTPDLVWVVDRDYRFVHANPAVLEMWGRRYDEVIGKGLREVGYEEWRARDRERLFDQVVATKQPLRSEASFPHATLGERVYDFIMSPVFDEAGEIEAITGTTRDVTDIKRTEQGLRESQRHLTELNRSLEHRVNERTAELQRQTDRLRELAAELTTAEQRERRRLAAMLHDDLQQLLVAAQIQLGRVRGRVDAEDGAEALARVEHLLDESMTASRNLTRQLRPPVLYEDGLVSALKGLASDFDERQLLTVHVAAHIARTGLSEDFEVMLFESVRELLLNVAKHAQASEATVDLRSEDACLYVAVADQGRGFDAHGEALERSRFEGFGLFSIRERLTALGGHVRIESTPGQGSRVELAVPINNETGDAVADAPWKGERAPERAAHVNGARVRIVIVDDHALVRQGIAHVLSEHPRVSVVGEAGDGVEALELLQQEQPDIVLMDVNMPRMNGIEATRETARRWPRILVVGLSVQDDEQTANLMREAGAVGFLPKTGDATEMVTQLLLLAEGHPGPDRA